MSVERVLRYNLIYSVFVFHKFIKSEFSNESNGGEKMIDFVSCRIVGQELIAVVLTSSLPNLSVSF